jgi:hypothetical protein
MNSFPKGNAREEVCNHSHLGTKHLETERKKKKKKLECNSSKFFAHLMVNIRYINSSADDFISLSQASSSVHTPSPLTKSIPLLTKTLIKLDLYEHKIR